ncbi:glutamate synthase subunit beta [Leadbettera azotonutricia]|uniref:Glutamate synthase [NADPH] small chain (Nadph-gogat) n=1 Tax=Leadbettera azotonutricia (strain ATCC BAA-888 / DSM 13862 / ZAS-9) TaxID=545695 RepID=F5YDX0_LEAAZ|nr:glutamate synthase subunit beta [Leadbettera azotonutricia]AEF83078.1 glutamate synthase [NADPH] small chain (nadph-gogat) [Leadbettera azotonutricia ZAS-9]
MGDPKGFLTIKRKVSGYRPVEERVNDYSEVEVQLPDEERRLQAARCMDCGVPFCHWSCPVSNVMPEWQDKVYRSDWVGAWAILQDTNPFPEFTGRVCPALCEASCVLGANDEPVTIRQNELAVIEKAFSLGLVVPRPPKARNNKKVAIVGAGPSGLSAAYFLNRFGFSVTVYEGDRKVGGYLRYGIPDFKLDKSFIDRRVRLMEQEGVVFKTSTRVGDAVYGFGTGSKDSAVISPKELESKYDLILLTIGARDARNIKVPGRENSGIVQALDFLSLQNRAVGKEQNEGAEPITAYGKRVVVIGGGDTGSDCVGTANRQGAMSVTQIEVMPKPPEHRPDSAPWPLWPTVLKTSSSHQEGGERLWAVNTKAFKGKDGKVSSLQLCKVEWAMKDGRFGMSDIPNTEFEINADLVLLAMGFTHVVQAGVVADFGLELDQRGNIRTAGSFHTSNPKVWAAGDAKNGASLVVRAIAEGRAAAEAIVKHLA